MISKFFVTVALLVCLLKQSFAQYTTTVLAGTGTQGWTGDNGPATSANLNFVASCFVDFNSNTFLVDYSANVVRMVNPAGIITTIGGTGNAGIANTGGAFTSVQLYSPWGVNGDSNYLYVSDNYHVWKYNRATGIVAIMAGTGTQGTAGDGGPATSAQINKANGLWLTTDGTLYIAEYGNNLVRKITTAKDPGFPRPRSLSWPAPLGAPASESLSLSANQLVPLLSLTQPLGRTTILPVDYRSATPFG